MRSLILKAAVAATVLTVPLAAFADPSDRPDYSENSGDHGPMGEPLPLPSPSGGFMNMLKAQPAPVIHQRVTFRPYLNTVERGLRKADARIDADRQHNWLTVAEAKQLRAQDAKIWRVAAADAKANHGRLSAAEYRALEARIASLNRTIGRDLA